MPAWIAYGRQTDFILIILIILLVQLFVAAIVFWALEKLTRFGYKYRQTIVMAPKTGIEPKPTPVATIRSTLDDNVV